MIGRRPLWKLYALLFVSSILIILLMVSIARAKEKPPILPPVGFRKPLPMLKMLCKDGLTTISVKETNDGVVIVVGKLSPPPITEKKDK